MSDDMYIEGLGRFIEESVSSFHTVKTIKKHLKENGFEEIKPEEPFKISNGGKYYVNIYDSSLMAFVIGKEKSNEHKFGLRCSVSHTDFPCFKIKPDYYMSEMSGKAGYMKINTEVYGGPILNTWLDRPLSIAGKVVIRGKSWQDNDTVLVNIKKSILTIPNLAIHMNKEVNKGVELNRQKDMLPIIAIVNDNETDNKIIEKLIVRELRDSGKNIKVEDILGFDLFIYQREQGCLVGMNDEMYSSPRLDNLTSVYAQMKALMNSKRDNGINLAMFYDNEEIGSKTKQGASSQIITLLLEKIYRSLGFDKEYMINDIIGGMMVSLDVAHAMHPNSPEKSDRTNRVILNEGLVIKEAASQSYANDAEGVAIIKRICEENDCKYQIFVNRSDMSGGQTLGSISSTVMPMRTIDIGIPLLAMHSARELMGKNDEKNLEKFLTGYYS